MTPANERARERFPLEQYPDHPAELEEGESYRLDPPRGPPVTIVVLEVRRGNDEGQGTVTIYEET